MREPSVDTGGFFVDLIGGCWFGFYESEISQTKKEARKPLQVIFFGTIYSTIVTL